MSTAVVCPNSRDREPTHFFCFRTISLILTRSGDLSDRAENSNAYVRAENSNAYVRAGPQQTTTKDHERSGPILLSQKKKAPNYVSASVARLESKVCECSSAGLPFLTYGSAAGLETSFSPNMA